MEKCFKLDNGFTVSNFFVDTDENEPIEDCLDNSPMQTSVRVKHNYYINRVFS